MGIDGMSEVEWNKLMDKHREEEREIELKSQAIADQVKTGMPWEYRNKEVIRKC